MGLMATNVGVTPVAWPGAISTNLRHALISSSNRRGQPAYKWHAVTPENSEAQAADCWCILHAQMGVWGNYLSLRTTSLPGPKM